MTRDRWGTAMTNPDMDADDADTARRPWEQPGALRRDVASHRGPALLLLAGAGLAAGWLAGRRHAARGAALAVSLLAAGCALARRHYPAARTGVASAAAAVATTAGATLAWLVLTANAQAWAMHDPQESLRDPRADSALNDGGLPRTPPQKVASWGGDWGGNVVVVTTPDPAGPTAM